jgi:hypothetical protein
MLEKAPSLVLVTIRASTYHKEYAFGPSLAAATLNCLFEHPVGHVRIGGPSLSPMGSALSILLFPNDYLMLIAVNVSIGGMEL